MQKVGDLARLKGQGSLRSGLPKQIANRAIARVWTRMAEVYGHKWTSQYGEVSDDSGHLSSAARTWAQGLAQLSLEEISIGFSRMVESGDEWPPSLPEFRKLCQVKLLAPYHRMAKSLPAPEVDPNLIRDSFAQMRKTLN